MTSRKKEEWIEIREAAAIVSENSGRGVSADYVRLLAHKGRIQMKPKDARQNYYLKSDVEVIRVRPRKKVEVSAIEQHEEQPLAEDADKAA